MSAYLPTFGFYSAQRMSRISNTLPWSCCTYGLNQLEITCFLFSEENNNLYLSMAENCVLQGLWGVHTLFSRMLANPFRATHGLMSYKTLIFKKIYSWKAELLYGSQRGRGWHTCGVCAQCMFELPIMATKLHVWLYAELHMEKV
jgi:hypothetical protein